MRTLERACVVGTQLRSELSRLEQYDFALLLLRRFMSVVLALALIGAVFTGMLTYHTLIATLAYTNGSSLTAGGLAQLPYVHGLVTNLMIAALSAYALSRTRMP